MIIYTHPKFEKSVTKWIINKPQLYARFKDRVRLFQFDPAHPVLRDHKLRGMKKNYRAFWITGDVRILYQVISKTEVIFMAIGSHNQVY